jgi:MYXO-CTERM domain-containing protein
MRSLVGFLVLAAATPASATTSIYLNGDGASLLDAQVADDPSVNASILVEEPTSIPAWTDAAAFAEMRGCLEEVLAPYDVDLVSVEPTEGVYYEVVIGGKPEYAGLPSTVVSAARASCDPAVAPAVILAFPQQGDRAIGAREMCHAVAGAIGFTAGLAPTAEAGDVMHLPDGSRSADAGRFLDRDVACASGACPCDGATTQNGHAEMLAMFGARPQDEAEPDAGPDAGDGDDAPADDLGEATDGEAGGCAAGGGASAGAAALLALAAALSRSRRRR